MDSLEQQYYEWDGFWDPEYYTLGETGKRIAATVALVPADVQTLVDVGSGTGEFGRQLVKKRPDVRVYCVDRSRAALKTVSTEKAVGSVDAIPLGDRSKDLASCLQVLEHLPVPIYRKALDELARVADRYLLISVPFEEDLAEKSTRCPACRSIFNADLHLRSYGLADVTSLFASQGFALRERKHVGFQEETLGLQTYERIRSVVAPRLPVFGSHLCPVCGYARETNGQRSPAGNTKKEFSPLRKLAQAAKARLPRRRRTDYWIIALYERQR